MFTLTLTAVDVELREREGQATAAVRRRRSGDGHSIDQQAATDKPAGRRSEIVAADQGHSYRTRRDESRRRRLIIILSTARSPPAVCLLCAKSCPHARPLCALNHTPTPARRRVRVRRLTRYSPPALGLEYRNIQNPHKDKSA